MNILNFFLFGYPAYLVMSLLSGNTIIWLLLIFFYFVLMRDKVLTHYLVSSIKLNSFGDGK